MQKSKCPLSLTEDVYQLLVSVSSTSTGIIAQQGGDSEQPSSFIELIQKRWGPRPGPRLCTTTTSDSQSNVPSQIFPAVLNPVAFSFYVAANVSGASEEQRRIFLASPTLVDRLR